MRKRFDTPEAECLPEPDEAPHSNPGSSVRPKVEAYWGRILVIDDNEHARQAVAGILESYGFDVVLAQDGEEGVAFYRALHRAIDAVVVDMQMPGMDGAETFLMLRAMNPQVKAILCSGAAPGARVEQALRDGVVAFLEKPFRAEQLIELIAGALGAGGERAGGA